MYAQCWEKGSTYFFLTHSPEVARHVSVGDGQGRFMDGSTLLHTSLPQTRQSLTPPPPLPGISGRENGSEVSNYS